MQLVLFAKGVYFPLSLYMCSFRGKQNEFKLEAHCSTCDVDFVIVFFISPLLNIKTKEEFF